MQKLLKQYQPYINKIISNHFVSLFIIFSCITFICLCITITMTSFLAQIIGTAVCLLFAGILHYFLSVP